MTEKDPAIVADAEWMEMVLREHLPDVSKRYALADSPELRAQIVREALSQIPKVVKEAIHDRLLERSAEREFDRLSGT